MVWYFILLSITEILVKKKKIKFYEKSNHLQSTAGFIACFITFYSINHTGHHIFKTVCSGTAFLFSRVPLPSIRITVLSQSRSQNQTKFVTCKRIQNNENYSLKDKLEKKYKNIEIFLSLFKCQYEKICNVGTWKLISNNKSQGNRIKNTLGALQTFRHVSNEIHG